MAALTSIFPISVQFSVPQTLSMGTAGSDYVPLALLQSVPSNITGEEGRGEGRREGGRGGRREECGGVRGSEGE